MGTGWMAGQFAQGLAWASGARLVAVASRSLGAAETFAGQYGVSRAMHGYEELTRDPEVDVVYIATPNALHHPHSLMALDAGKAVLCEKPFALDAAQCAEVIERARRRNLFCMEAMWMRFSPALRAALQIAYSGAIGEIRLLTAQLGFSYVPDPTSRLFAPPGAGALLDLGVYPLSLAQALFGRPRRVASQTQLDAAGVDEQVTALLDYGDSRQASVAASLRGHLANAAAICGTEGTIAVEPLWFPDRYHLARAPTRQLPTRTPPSALSRLHLPSWARALASFSGRRQQSTVIRRAPGNGYGVQAAEVMRCLREGLSESPDVPLDATLAVAESMDAVRRQWTDTRSASGQETGQRPASR